jgi:sporulation protein YlmC with PRC-barrel domain
LDLRLVTAGQSGFRPSSWLMVDRNGAARRAALPWRPGIQRSLRGRPVVSWEGRYLGALSEIFIDEERGKGKGTRLDPEVEVEFGRKPVFVASRIVGGNNNVAMVIESEDARKPVHGFFLRGPDSSGFVLPAPGDLINA